MRIKNGKGVGSWFLQLVHHTCGLGVWKTIRARWNCFCRFVGYGVGDGRLIR